MVNKGIWNKKGPNWLKMPPDLKYDRVDHVWCQAYDFLFLNWLRNGFLWMVLFPNHAYCYNSEYIPFPVFSDVDINDDIINEADISVLTCSTEYLVKNVHKQVVHLGGSSL